MRPRLITLAAILTTSTAFAHEGHGTPGEGHTVAHYATQPLHVVSLVVLVLAFGIGGLVWKRRHESRRTR